VRDVNGKAVSRQGSGNRSWLWWKCPQLEPLEKLIDFLSATGPVILGSDPGSVVESEWVGKSGVGTEGKGGW
jgi:hypothetical protein